MSGSIPPNAEQVVQWILEHPDQCPDAGGASTRANLNDFDADSDSDSASTDTVEESPAGATAASDARYSLWSDFKSPDQYAMYVRGLVVPGMIVRCCRDFEEIRKGDIGTVLKVDTEGLHDLNVQVDWQRHGAHYWMCFFHIELVEPPPPAPKVDECDSTTTNADAKEIRIGSHVRIRANVSMPCYKWGSVVRGSIGVVTAINDRDVTVDFPQQYNWTGQLCEMELVCQANPASALSNGTAPAVGDLIEDWSRFVVFSDSTKFIINLLYHPIQMHSIIDCFIE